jgi:hypothetical protein
VASVLAGDRRVRPAPAAALQRALTVAGVNYTARTQTVPPEQVNALATEIVNAIGAQSASLTEDQRKRITDNEAAILQQLCMWIEDPAGQARAKAHPVYGHKRQDRHYVTMPDLAIALLGWVEAKQGRRDEKALANKAAGDAVIALHLDNLLSKINVKVHYLHGPDRQQPRLPVDATLRNGILQELTSGKAKIMNPGGEEEKEIGHYRHYMESIAAKPGALQLSFGGNYMKVLSKPQDFSIWEKMVVLHDLMEYFGDARAWVTKSKGEGQLPAVGSNSPEARSTTAIDASGKRTAFTNDRGFVPGHPSTRNESEASTQFARQLRIPVWAGASMTTVRMLNLARWAGASKSELGSVAWGIFAFWRRAYDHTSELAYHTLHEVMDMAQNFGVGYNVLDRGAGLGSFTLDRLGAEVQATWTMLNADGLELEHAMKSQSGTHPITQSAQEYLDRIRHFVLESNKAWLSLRGQPRDAQLATLRQIGVLLAEGVRVYNLLWMSVDQHIRDFVELPPYVDSDEEEEGDDPTRKGKEKKEKV